MLCTNLIRKKRFGKVLDADEWHFLIDSFCDGSVTDAQMAAMAMAICIRGLTPDEIFCLTNEMLASGTRLPRVSDRPRVDKHSTGGLGDKVSLILAPLLASLGCDVPMISGRGLGRTGGTLDKLEAIEGFQTSLSIEESSKVLAEVGAFIIGADERIAPADRRLYALRDVTATVESVGLITASILSKKLAASLDALVMDVKVGSGGFMPTHGEAIELAESLVRVGEQSGMPTRAILSDMDQPLGDAFGASIGNAIEVNEAIAVLSDQRSSELNSPVRELTIALSASALVQAGVMADLATAETKLRERLASGHAMERFEKMVVAQGGHLNGPLPVARRRDFLAERDGFVERINCPAIGDAIIAAGGGRKRGGEKLDHRVGIQTFVRVGDAVKKGQVLFAIFDDSDSIATSIQNASGPWVSLSETPVAARDLILESIPSDPVAQHATT
ncbi:thymidine phosphorylase [Aporhodopirellula aestuarii]|uniref:thymidine phosphorylase n=1 Tax=Aporhodopirellula aestuarii TaxID=2950107 RepID=A0ABT0U5I6_9BACT|nr:thymidine phosphorylase [Aporhodopirellula aestuarii]MCM2372199.1 thymidine phosphorylase [Aporhodopirellula aestuarii]